MQHKDNENNHHKFHRSTKALAHFGLGAVPKLLVSLLVIVTCLTVGAGGTYAWYFINENVQAKNMAAATGILPKISYKLSTEEDAAYQVIDNEAPLELVGYLAYPGITVDVDVRVENVGQYPFSIDGFGLLRAAESEEQPNSKGVYLGTQLAVRLVGITGYNAQAQSVEYQVPMAGDAPAEGHYLAAVAQDNQLVTEDILLYNGALAQSPIILGQNEAAVLTLRVSFVETNENQNAYKFFGRLKEDNTPDGFCGRRIFVECVER